MIWLQIFFNTVLFQGIWTDETFIILHNNDMHARFDEHNKSIGRRSVAGMARVAYKVNEFRKVAKEKKGPPVLFLNAGDSFTGTIWFSLYRWKIVLEFLNLLQPDVMTLGNHEFDDGMANLTKFVQNAKFKIVCSNTRFRSPEINKYIKPSTIFDIGKLKVGVIGIVTTTSKFVLDRDEVHFDDEIESVRKEAEKLKTSGVHVVIALGHIGFDVDLQLAEEVEEVDVVVGGHTNTFLFSGREPDLEKAVDVYPKIVVQSSGKKVPVVQAFAYTKYLGVLNLTFSDKGKLLNYSGQPIFLSNDVPKDPAVDKLVNHYKMLIGNSTKTVIGESKHFLSVLECRYAECGVGNLLTDAFIEYMVEENATPYWTSCAIAFVNGGSMRASIKAGPVTTLDVLDAFPFYQQLVAFEINGSDLVGALEIAVKSEIAADLDGDFVQQSGLMVTLDRSKRPGERVVSVDVRCQQCIKPSYEPINLQETYKVVTNSFLANGGDGQVGLRENKKNVRTLEILDNDAVIRFFKKYQVVNVQVGDRFKETSLRASRGGRIIIDIAAVLYILFIYQLYNCFYS